jgi:hypothetical protein
MTNVFGAFDPSMISPQLRHSASKVRVARRALLGAVIAVALRLPGSAEAQSLQNAVLRNSFNPVGAGARGAGMGGAFIAVADDGTAASFNPAGLTLLRRKELAVVVFNSRLVSTTTEEFPTRQTLSDRMIHTVPEFVGFAYPFELHGRHTTLQLSYQRAVDLFGRGMASVAFSMPAALLEKHGLPPMPAEYYVRVNSEQGGALHTATLSAAHEISDRLSFGVAFNIWIGDWRAAGTRNVDVCGEIVRNSAMAQYPLIQEFYDWESHCLPYAEHNFTQDHNLLGVNLNIGVLFRASKISLGGILRRPFAARHRLYEHGDGYIWIDDQYENKNEDALINTTLRWPWSAGVGAAYRPVRGLTLSGECTLTSWSRMIIDDVPYKALLTDYYPDLEPTVTKYLFVDRNFIDLFPAPMTKVKDTGSWRFGIEYLLNLPCFVLPLRAGVFQERSPILDMRSLSGRHINGQTLGIGISFDRVAFDLAFERRTNTSAVGVTVEGDPPEIPTGTIADESVVHHRLIGSLILRFGRRGGSVANRPAVTRQ